MSAMEELKEQVAKAINEAGDLKALDNVRVSALGKKGSVTGLMQKIGGLPPEERKSYGQAVNDVKVALESQLEEKKVLLKRVELDKRLIEETLDVSLPVRDQIEGSIHPITHAMEELISIFADMGFDTVTGPELEDDYHNFTALNFPADHPARAAHDTLYIQPEEGSDEEYLLRTHTSPVQIRLMETSKPPFRAIMPGRTYRSDYDMTHTPMFHQIEGLVVDKETHAGHLKGCLQEALAKFFGVENLKMRGRIHHFPFTEPSFEMDIGYTRSNGELKIGEGDSWMEILGCGMVHPNVLRACNLDPDEYQGFAFGMGIERLAMLKYGIPDLRTFFESDMRWLKHYGFDVTERPNMALGGAKQNKDKNKG